MTWIVPKLNKRVQILKPNMKEESEGGFDFVFGEGMGSGFDYGAFSQLDALKTVWMECKPAIRSGFGTVSQYVRGEQITENITHNFKVRKEALIGLGRGFSLGFSIGFDSIDDLIILKSQYYLFMESGSDVKGRLFRIKGVVNNKEQNEYYKISAEEIEERGTGYPS